MLHITNGDCAVAVLSQAVTGSILPWRDVLHEGPVRAVLSLEELSAERAAFIAAAGWGEQKKVRDDFQGRDSAFRRAGEHDEIVLWFEHDLYDQLQLIQVLDGLAELRGPPVSLVCEAEYLGAMAPERAAELFSLRNPVTRRHLQEASAAWAAFRSPTPQELPDGLSLLERHIVEALRQGTLAFAQILGRVEEDPAFLGDAVLAWHLERLSKEGLVERRADDWALTGKKRQRRLPRWLGGYEVKDEALRWDPGLSRLVS